MKGRILIGLAVLFLGAWGTSPIAGEATEYERLLGHYESIRAALLLDSTEGVEAHAQSMEAIAKDATESFDPSRVGVPADRSAECEDLLALIREAAAQLARASSLAEARDTFSEVSRPMLRLREMAGGGDSIVVYCSMARKAWLQPAGEIGNPYYGQKMARCGEVVKD